MFQKGESGNIAGRPKGTKDKTNKEIRERFNDLLENNLSKIDDWLTSTAAKDPAKALDLLLKLSEFVLPKLKSVEMTVDEPQRPVMNIWVQDQDTAKELEKLKCM